MLKNLRIKMVVWSSKKTKTGIPSMNRLVGVIAVCFFAAYMAAAQTPFVSKVWKADNGDGTYKNPIIFADYSDPDAVRVGDNFYLTASSFNAAPGLPILHSKDLVNWCLINYVFTKQIPTDVFSETGLFCPTPL